MSENQKFYAVPLYADLNEADKAIADGLIAQLDWKQPDSMKTLQQEILTDLGKVTSQIISVMREEPNGVFTSGLTKVKNAMTEFDMGALSKELVQQTQKGLKVVGKNKEFAIAGFGLATGNFIMAGLGGALGIRKLVKANKARNGNTMEALEERIGQALNAVEEGVTELKIAEVRAPELKSRLSHLHRSNRAAFNASNIAISAGREYLRQLDDVILPELKQINDAVSTFDSDENILLASESRRVLSQSLAVMENVRAESVNSSTLLHSMGQAISISEESVASLLSSEVPAWQRDVAMAGFALDTHRMAKVAQEFRDQVDSMRSDAVAATQGALLAAQSGKIDDPERLERAIQRTDNLKLVFQERAKTIAESEAVSEQLRARLESSVNNLLGVITEATVSNGKALSAPAPKDQLKLVQ